MDPMSTTQAAPFASRSIATRRTAQGSIVHLWQDGAITWALGRYIDGSAHPRTAEQATCALVAGWLVMGDVELYDDEEVPALIAAARWTAARNGTPGEMRSRLHRRAPLRPVWLTLESDRDGRPVVQCWKLPRLRWPGLAIWKDRGRYSAWNEVCGSGTYEPTGCEFANLREVAVYLDSFGGDR